jgi:hypothetical protein
MASAFGVAGSSVMLAAWVYYSSMVFFFGAALTCVYAEHWMGEGPVSGDPGTVVSHIAVGLAVLALIPAAPGRVDALGGTRASTPSTKTTTLSTWRTSLNSKILRSIGSSGGQQHRPHPSNSLHGIGETPVMRNAKNLQAGSIRFETQLGY